MKLDPLPWGGDTFERVASNMGNSIFVAAYLIMTFFVAVYKTIESIIAIVRSPRVQLADVVRAAAYIVIILMNLVVVLCWPARAARSWVGLAGRVLYAHADGAADSLAQAAAGRDRSARSVWA